MPDAAELLRHARVEVAPETYVLVGMRHADWARLLENPELSPRAERRDSSILKERVRLELKRYIQKQTGARPVILPVVVQI